MSGRFVNTPNEIPLFFELLNRRLGHIRDNNPGLFPSFPENTSVFSFSDYGGEHKGAPYQCLAFTIIDWLSCGFWNDKRTKLRQCGLGFQRHMEYKKLNDKIKEKHLGSFLQITDYLPGLLFILIMPNNMGTVFNEGQPHEYLKEQGLGDWKPKVAEKLFRILHIQCLLVCGLTGQNNKFFWYTDRDAITKDMKALGDIFKGVLNLYCPHGFKVTGYAEEFEQNDKLRFSDPLSYSDLAAGAVQDHLHICKEKGIDPLDRDRASEIEVRPKTAEIFKWLTRTNIVFKKLFIRVELIDGHWKFSIATLQPNKL